MKIITFTGPSCSGKTTLLNELVNNHGYASIVSHTTRPPRPNETEGVDYYFIEQNKFDEMSKSGGFMEHISFNGFSYGVSAEEMAKATQGGKTAVLIVEPFGLAQIKKYCTNHKVPLHSVYIHGELINLITRYIRRMQGESIDQVSVASRHAKRLDSLIKEHNNWITAHQYDTFISRFDEGTQEQTIDLIKTLEF
jgi:guanylate kinase